MIQKNYQKDLLFPILPLIMGKMARPAIRCFYAGQDRLFGNLGDLLMPAIVNGFGYECAFQDDPDEKVVNPGKCMIGIGSLLAKFYLDPILKNWDLDIWGSGWRGPDDLTEVSGGRHPVFSPDF